MGVSLGFARSGCLTLGHVDEYGVIMPMSYASEFPRDVLDLVEEGRPVAVVCDRLGVSGESFDNRV